MTNNVKELMTDNMEEGESMYQKGVHVYKGASYPRNHTQVLKNVRLSYQLESHRVVPLKISILLPAQHRKQIYQQ